MNIVRFGSIAAASTLCVISLITCGPSKPKASDYIGHWEGPNRTGSGSERPCHLHISLVGESLVVKSEDQRSERCEDYAQVLSLSDDGTAKGGPMGMITLLFDKEKNEIIVSGGSAPGNLRKAPEYHENRDRFPGTWKKVKTDGGQLLTDVLLIELRDDGTFAVREQEVIDNHQFLNVSYDNGVIRGTFEMAVDSTYRSPFSITSTGPQTMTYTDERGSESFQKQ
jgi:hypothetical protein